MKVENDPASRDEAGFSLVEIVVSMFILAVLSLSLLPLLVQGVKLAAVNSTQASANRVVYDRIEQARATESCAAVLSQTGSTTTSLDSRGNSFVITGTAGVSACPTAYPAVIKLTVSVAKATQPAKSLASASTLVLVRRAS
jgi:prepilin-type N-terminal cleavage/methylation domain-containing protein